ncbi:GNAT family N-acetyltransferase [Sphingomonas agri]|uniref:GNAT family N-acetyltransferase n=1 Tax=Sphingomonas agri TaxID=1813878 RepID=UPI00311F4D84
MRTATGGASPAAQPASASRVVVGPLGLRHEQAWRRLWEGYLAFYEESIPPQVTDRSWQMLVNAENRTMGLAAEADGELVGFANILVHSRTWSSGPAAYLEDLYVRGDCRGRGVGRALIEAVLERGRQRGWSEVYWHTAADNAAARKLYDQFTAVDDHVRYRVFLP